MKVLVTVLVIEIISLVSAQRGSSYCEDWGDLPYGKVKARNKGRVLKFACNRGYTLVGSDVATCIRREWMLGYGTQPVCVRNGCKALSSPPNGRLQIETGGAVARVKCNPGYRLQNESLSFLFCDGSDWNGTVPICIDSASLSPTSCTFEEGYCYWTQDPGHDIDWERQKFGTPSGHIGTGPSFDHTLGEGHDGYYIYLETSGSRSLNDSGRLYSPAFKPALSRDSCFIFWYHMFGSTMGILNVYLKPGSKEFAQSKLLFQKSGNLGNQWMQAILPLEEVNENFQIVIEGLRGSSYMSDMAVDDVSLGKGEECLTPATTTVTTPETTPKPTISPFLSCNGKCGLMLNTPDGNVCSCAPACLIDANCCLDYTTYCLETSAGVTTEPAMTSSIQQEAVTVVETTPAASTSSLASVASIETTSTILLSSTFSTEVFLTSTQQYNTEETTTTTANGVENTSLFDVSLKTDSTSHDTKMTETTTSSSVDRNSTTMPYNTSLNTEIATTIETTVNRIIENVTVLEPTVTPEAITSVTTTKQPTTSETTTKPTTRSTSLSTKTEATTLTFRTETVASKTTAQTASTVRSTSTTSTPVLTAKVTSETSTEYLTTNTPTRTQMTTPTSHTVSKPSVTSKVNFSYIDDTQIASNEISSQSGFQSGEIETSNLGGSNIIIVVSVLGLTACATIAVIVTVLRRKRVSQGRQESLPEDSDVRYLHNDEEVEIDLAEQQPKNKRKSLAFGFEEL